MTAHFKQCTKYLSVLMCCLTVGGCAIYWPSVESYAETRDDKIDIYEKLHRDVLVFGVNMRLPKPFGGEPTLDATIHLDGATVVYVGRISRLSVDTVIELIDSHPVEAIEMTSQGGAGLHAVRLANAIIDNSIQVTLKELCMSACANYILPAGKPTVIKPKTILGWHGSAAFMSCDDLLDRGRHSARRNVDNPEHLRKYVASFYRRLGADPRIMFSGYLSGTTHNLFSLSEKEIRAFLPNSQLHFEDYQRSDIEWLGGKKHAQRIAKILECVAELETYFFDG
jgi:hypothetical protein|tara:strand:- start:1168 stop:2013 length:846 start_codon:yes stop_codon:yes gene_type:complete